MCKGFRNLSLDKRDRKNWTVVTYNNQKRRSFKNVLNSCSVFLTLTRLCNYTQHIHTEIFLDAHRKKGLDLIQKLWCVCGINFGFQKRALKEFANQRDIFSSRRHQYLFFFYRIQRIKFENVSRESYITPFLKVLW